MKFLDRVKKFVFGDYKKPNKKTKNKEVKSLVDNSKTYILDQKNPKNKYNIIQLIAEWGRMRGHIERLEYELNKKDQIIKDLLNQNKQIQIKPMSKAKSEILKLLKNNKLNRDQFINKIINSKNIKVTSRSRAYSIINELINANYIKLDNANYILNNNDQNN